MTLLQLNVALEGVWDCQGGGAELSTWTQCSPWGSPTFGSGTSFAKSWPKTSVDVPVGFVTNQKESEAPCSAPDQVDTSPSSG